jgi:type I restriction enzyme R subunit
MRHLIDTYIEAAEPRKISDFGEIGLLELIVKSGLAAALASLPDSIRGSRGAVAETIANNVRSKIIREHLNDPAFYDTMSALLGEILADLRAARIDYEEFLRRIAELAKSVQAGTADDTPAQLDTPGKRALFSNLRPATAAAGSDRAADGTAAYRTGNDSVLELALRLDAAVKRQRPNAWRDVRAKEQVIKAALYGELQDAAAVERIFLIVKAQPEY